MSRRELAVRDALRELRIEVFCPRREVQHRRKLRGRERWVTEQREVAAFPGYLFAKSYECEPLRLVSGVLDVVRCGVVPLCVPEGLVEHLRATSGDDGLMTRREVQHWFNRKVGDEFVFRGSTPWAGFVGQISDLGRLEAHNEIKAMVSLFGRMSEVTLDVSYVGRAISGSQIGAAAA